MDQSLKCNNLKCRQPLTYTSKACVTSCSHIFCLKCAQSAFSRSSVCPACETQEDVIMANLNPSESFKSSILAGFSPETIIEVCSKGLAFWNYQQSQEVYYQELLCQNLKDKRDVLAQKIKQVIHSANDEIALLKTKINELISQKDEDKQKINQLSLQFIDKNKQFLKLQAHYEKLKRNNMILSSRNSMDREQPELEIQNPFRSQTNGSNGFSSFMNNFGFKNRYI